MGTLEVFKTLGGIMKLDRVKDIANFLVKQHKPKTYDYSKKYPIKKAFSDTPSIQSNIKENILEKIPQETNIQLCSKCKSSDIEIRYGRYGYYFKCLSCDGNKAIKLTCTDSNCKAKLKKSKLNFYHICEVCNKNELFFKNPEAVLEKSAS